MNEYSIYFRFGLSWEEGTLGCAIFSFGVLCPDHTRMLMFRESVQKFGVLHIFQKCIRLNLRLSVKKFEH